ncbi:hypothetical protein A6804_12435 [Escherichia coli]|nr:hypothetical protein A6804_12435 [Escherichia coli]
MMNPVPWLQMTNMISYQGLVRTFLSCFSLSTTSSGIRVEIMAVKLATISVNLFTACCLLLSLIMATPVYVFVWKNSPPQTTTKNVVLYFLPP